MVSEPYDVRRLLLLREVGRSGSLTEAARRLSFTTSAVSQQIARLELETGVTLLDRGPRGVRLTDAGRALVGYADSVDRLLAAARAEMADYAGLRRGGLQLATFPTAAAALMPFFVTEFRKRFPQINLEIRSARLGPIIDMVLRREAELATLWEYPWLPVPKSELELVPVMVDPTVALIPESHRLSHRRTIALAELAQEKWVTRADHPVTDVLQRVCRKVGFEPTVVFAASDYPELQAMVAADVGVALAPRLAVLDPRRNVRVLALRGNPAPRRILVAWAKGRRPTPAMRSGLLVLREAVAAIADGHGSEDDFSSS